MVHRRRQAQAGRTGPLDFIVGRDGFTGNLRETHSTRPLRGKARRQKAREAKKRNDKRVRSRKSGVTCGDVSLETDKQQVQERPEELQGDHRKCS